MLLINFSCFMCSFNTRMAYRIVRFYGCISYALPKAFLCLMANKWSDVTVSFYQAFTTPLLSFLSQHRSVLSFSATPTAGLTSLKAFSFFQLYYLFTYFLLIFNSPLYMVCYNNTIVSSFFFLAPFL